MKVLLQRTDSPCYLKRAGKWVRRCSDAAVFPNVAAALFFCRSHHIDHVRLVLDLDAGVPMEPIPLLCVDEQN